MTDQQIIDQCEAAGYVTSFEPTDVKLDHNERRYRICAEHFETYEKTENVVFIANDRIWIENEAGMVYEDLSLLTRESLGLALQYGVKDLPLLPNPS